MSYFQSVRWLRGSAADTGSNGRAAAAALTPPPHDEQSRRSEDAPTIEGNLGAEPIRVFASSERTGLVARGVVGRRDSCLAGSEMESDQEESAEGRDVTTARVNPAIARLRSSNSSLSGPNQP